MSYAPIKQTSYEKGWNKGMDVGLLIGAIMVIIVSSMLIFIGFPEHKQRGYQQGINDTLNNQTLLNQTFKSMPIYNQTLEEGFSTCVKVISLKATYNQNITIIDFYGNEKIFEVRK